MLNMLLHLIKHLHYILKSLILLPVITCCCVLLTTELHGQDLLFLKNKNRLSGKLETSNSAGVILLNYPEAKLPLKIKESSIQKILFQEKKNVVPTSSEKIHFTNGDSLACTILTLNEKTISFKSSITTKQTIHRNLVSKIEFNTNSDRIIYKGPTNDSNEWHNKTNSWKFEKNKLTTTKIGYISKKINKLTTNYIIQFQLKFPNKPPKLRFCFSANSNKLNRDSQCYYMDINSHGIIVHAYNKGVTNKLMAVAASNKLYHNSKVNIGLHVNRDKKQIALYTNGKLVAVTKKAIINPTGNCIIFENKQHRGILTELSDINTTTSYSDKTPMSLAVVDEKINKHDVISDLNGKQSNGQIIGFIKENDQDVIKFLPLFAKKTTNIPRNNISTLGFKKETSTPTHKKANYLLTLTSGNKISFSSSQIIDKNIAIQHPLLGKLQFPVNLASSIEAITK